MTADEAKTTEEYWETPVKFKQKKEITIPTKISDIEYSRSSAGPFLFLLMEKLKNFLSNSFYVNLHLTGLISKLASYPQPLLRAYLLDHSLVLQPTVPSIFEVSF